MKLYKIYMDHIDAKLGKFQFFFIAIIILKFSQLSVPFYYEEKPNTIFEVSRNSLIDIILGNYPVGSFADHEPLLPLYSSIWSYFFGFSPLIIHLGMAFITSIGITFLYFLFIRLRSNNTFSWLPCILLFFTPTFFIHSTNYRIDIFTAAIAIAYLYSRVKERTIAFLIMGMLLAYSRETTVAIITSTLLVDLFNKQNKRLKYISFFHIVIWSLFFISNIYFHGSLTTSIAKNQLNSDIVSYLKIFWFDIKFIFIDEYRFILSSIGLMSLFLKKNISKERLLTFLPMLFYCFGMAFHVFEASYYLFPILPFYYLGISLYISDILKTKFVITLCIIWIGLGIYQNEINKQEILAENSTYYGLITENFKETIKYLNEKHKGKTVNLEWPLVYYARSSVFGYFEGEIPRYQVISLAEEKNIWASKLGHKVDGSFDCNNLGFSLVGISKHGNELQAQFQKRIVKQCNFILIDTIENSMGQVDFYERK